MVDICDRTTRNLPALYTFLDFDGTLTDVEAEAVPFLAGFKQSFAQYFLFTNEFLEDVWQPKELEIRNHPQKYGWCDDSGCIVAPATADFLILSRVTGDLILRALKDAPEMYGLSSFSKSLPQNDKERGTLLEDFFQCNYMKLGTVFRPGAAAFLKAVVTLGPVSIITNSDAEKVQLKLAKLREACPDLPEIDVQGIHFSHSILSRWR